MKPAPNFSLTDQQGVVRTLKEYAGKWVVLYFYPQDDTPGCTTEACNFRDQRDLIASEGHAEVIGVSKDSIASHRKFAEKYHLNFTLLSDPDHGVIEAYGAWKPKKMFGKEYLGTLRNTVIINPEGQIVKEYEGVDPRKHAQAIIADLRVLQTQA